MSSFFFAHPTVFPLCLLLILCVGVQLTGGSPEDVPCRCHNREIPDETRLKIVEFHNHVRLQLASGETENRRGKLPSAKNMHKLIWSCYLEIEAEILMNSGRPDLTYRWRRSYGYNAITKYNPKEMPVDYTRDLKPVLESWWGEAKKYNQYKNYFNDLSVKDFANMASGNNTEIGCTYKVYELFTHFICVYYFGAKQYKMIYELGPGPCNEHKNCTAYKDALCAREGLCLKSSWNHV
ncbi:hypothetical protein RB195_005761 [Necator americanus]|uniref:SCP domain-containing protein n=1 Tax=Necator americanus TaxID=51031 RepID=A0ABR1BPI7_NECAM